MLQPAVGALTPVVVGVEGVPGRCLRLGEDVGFRGWNEDAEEVERCCVVDKEGTFLVGASQASRKEACRTAEKNHWGCSGSRASSHHLEEAVGALSCDGIGYHDAHGPREEGEGEGDPRSSQLDCHRHLDHEQMGSDRQERRGSDCNKDLGFQRGLADPEPVEHLPEKDCIEGPTSCWVHNR